MFQKVRDLKAQGLKQSQIAKELGIDRKTVAKYLSSNTPPKYGPRKGVTKKDPFSAFEPRAKFLLDQTPKITAREIFEFILEEGYRGSERTVDRRIAQILGEKPKERYFEQEYRAAEQAQFDFKECVEFAFVDGVRSVQLHFGTLPFSDTCRVRGYPGLTYECFMDGVHHFFENIGGLTSNIRIDNLSPCVVKVLPNSKRIWTAAFARAIEYYDFGVLPCTPAKGNEKGDVERDIRTYARRLANYVKNRGIVFKDWVELNVFLSDYMEEHQKEESRERLKIEKAQLSTLPPRDEEILCRVERVPATSYGTVRLAKSTYSVPDHAISVNCRVVSSPYGVTIWREGGAKECLAVHPRKPDGENSILLEHILPSLIRKPQAMVRWAHRHLLFPSPVFEKFYKRLKTIDSQSAEREFLRAVNLVHFTTLSEIAAGMELILETHTENIFDDLKQLLLGRRVPCNVIEISMRENQSPLNPKLSLYDSFIPKTGVIP
jgi:transposase